MNKKFLSAILFGALMVTSTGTFVSCKDYDDDIDRIDKELSEVKTQIAALQTKIDAGKWITSVTPATGGFTVAFSDGSSYTITNGKDGLNGEAGAPGTEWTISEDGFWVCNGEKTTVKAVGQDGAPGEAGKPGEDAQPEVKKENGKWYLWNGTEFEEFAGAEAPAANVPYYYADPTDPNNYAILVVCDENGKNEQEIRLPLNEGLAQIAILDDALKIYYSIATGNKDLQEWKGPKGAPAKGSYIVTYSADSIMVQVTPNNYDLSKTAVKLVNSLNEEAPVVLGTPVAYEGLYTKSRAIESANGLFQIPFSVGTITDEVVEKYGDAEKVPALALVASDKVRSTYATTLSIQKISDVDFNTFYISKHPEYGYPQKNIEPGKTGTLKPLENADQLYDAYVTINEGQEADAIKWEVKVDGMTISCSEAAKGRSMYFTVHTLAVSGQVQEYPVEITFNQEMVENAIEFETQKHVATGDADKQFMLVDLAPYFKDMSEEERILWNADAWVSQWNIPVEWVYTDENTGKEETDNPYLIQIVEMAKADGTVTRDNKECAKLKVTFVGNYNNVAFGNGIFTAKVSINNSYANTRDVISIPFTIANPADAEIAAQYLYNPAYYNATSKVFTVPSATEVDLARLIKGNINYAEAEAEDDTKLTVDVTTGNIALVNLEDLGKAYGVDGLRVNYMGRQFDIPAIKVQFIQFKNYKFTTANTLTLQSGKAEAAAKVLYGQPGKNDKNAYYGFKTLLGDNVAAANVKNVTVACSSPVSTESGNPLIQNMHVDENNNIVFDFIGEKTTEDTTVSIKVKATVTVDGVSEEIEGVVTVNIKKYPNE